MSIVSDYPWAFAISPLVKYESIEYRNFLQQLVAQSNREFFQDISQPTPRVTAQALRDVIESAPPTTIT